MASVGIQSTRRRLLASSVDEVSVSKILVRETENRREASVHLWLKKLNSQNAVELSVSDVSECAEKPPCHD